jgi:hypothetical protein
MVDPLNSGCCKQKAAGFKSNSAGKETGEIGTKSEETT